MPGRLWQTDSHMKRVLIIDDDVELCRLLEQYLGGEGFAITCAHDGGRPLANAPAYLLCDGRLAAAGTTSEQGWFELEGHLVSPVELWLFDEAEKPINFTLD